MCASVEGTSDPKSIFAKPFFSRQVALVSSAFIRPIHPKTEIRPDPVVLKRILDSGWVGQLKIHGHRAQIHIPTDDSKKTIVYTRHGTLHKKEIPPSAVSELRRLFQPKNGWNVLDAEWLKDHDRFYVFDFLKLHDEVLSHLSYQERWKLLPREYLSPHLVTLPLLATLEKCLEAMKSPQDYIEGLVLRSLHTPGFSDTSIVRCRKQKS